MRPFSDKTFLQKCWRKLLSFEWICNVIRPKYTKAYRSQNILHFPILLDAVYYGAS